MLELDVDGENLDFGGGVQRKKLRGSATGLVFVCVFVRVALLSDFRECFSSVCL